MKKILLILSVFIVIYSCKKEQKNDINPLHKNNDIFVNQNISQRRVFVLYADGLNSLCTNIEDNFKSLLSGYLPSKYGNDNVLLVYLKLPQKDGGFLNTTIRDKISGDINNNFYVNNKSYLLRLYRDDNNVAKIDTLVIYKKEVLAANYNTLDTVLTYAHQHFKAGSYGLMISSHGSGWLPKGYLDYGHIINDNYKDYKPVEGNNGVIIVNEKIIPPPDKEKKPSTRSFCKDAFNGEIHEMDMMQMAAHITYKLDYLIIDACYGAETEVAYQIKDKVKYLLASPTEIIDEGMVYDKIAKHLLGERDNLLDRLKEICDDYYNYYNSQQGDKKSASVSIIDCSKIENLATVVKTLISKYRDKIMSLDRSKIQSFTRTAKFLWVFDLKNIFVNTNIKEDELNNLSKSIDDCVLYKLHTDTYYTTLKLSHFCGISMYLPIKTAAPLNDYYKKLAWNQVIELVK